MGGAAHGRQVGRALLHPASLGAIAVLLLNDHVLKGAYPGAWTGKISDLAGLLFFPVLLFTLVEVAALLIHRPTPGVRAAFVVCAVSAVGFTLAKTVPWANEAYRGTLAYLRWFPVAAWETLAHRSPPPRASVDLVPDPTDLLALLAVVLAFLLIRRCISECDTERVTQT